MPHLLTVENLSVDFNTTDGVFRTVKNVSFNVEKGQILHLSDLKLPEGVSLPQLALGEDHDNAIAAIH